MNLLATIMKLLHVLSAFWFIAGLLGRGVTLSQASKSTDVQTAHALAQLGGRFDRLMVIPGSFAVLLLFAQSPRPRGRADRGDAVGEQVLLEM